MQNDIQTIIEPVIPLFARIDGASPETMVTAYHALGTQLMQASANSPSPALLKAIADTLKEAAPAQQTISINNLRAIYRFAKEYKADDLVQKKLASIPWSYHTVLLHTVQDSQARLFYCDAILKYHWSRAALIRNIHSNLYERHARVVTNFSSTLPRSYAQQAHMAFKQTYIFAMNEDVTTEREIEDALMTHITDFLKELGPGFAFIGRQYHIQTVGDDCYIDLLLYHTLLRCYVVIELKNGSLKPEYAGKMHFYMQAVDAALKTAHDNQTIGLILCRSTSPATIATLYDAAKPMVVAEYQLKHRAEKIDKKSVGPVTKRWFPWSRGAYIAILISIIGIIGYAILLYVK
jgi:predicted nuclease of restriction endonuclease-like (RecB) superfamily